jgi:uncharacterized protein YcfJ
VFNDIRYLFMESAMNNKSIIALALAMIGGSAYAASDYVDTAQVISSKPIIERVAESRQECDPAPAPQKSGSSIIAPILGGVVGGLLGHQVGQGRGQTAATIAGAAGGAVAGSAIANRTGQQPAQQCRNVQSSREVVNGYDVVYRYNGRDVNVALPYDPGKTIKVGVAAILDERTADGRRDNDRDARPVSSANTGDNYNDVSYRGRTSQQ